MHVRSLTAPLILTVLLFTGCAKPITEWPIPKRQASVSLSPDLLSMESPRVAVLRELRPPSEQNTVQLDLQYGPTRFGDGTGGEFVVREPDGNVAFERALYMEMGETSPITAALGALLVERGCTLADRELIERMRKNAPTTTNVGPALAEDLGRKLEADVLLVYAALGGNHVYYADKDRSWTYFLDPEMRIDGRFVATRDGRTLGTFQLRTSLAAEQGVQRLGLYPTGDKDLQIKEEGKRRGFNDPWQAAADALRAELAKHWAK
jgi:hypothetical protein